MSKNSSTSPAVSQPGFIDNIESLLDLSEYDTVSFQSSPLSPETGKAPFARPTTTQTVTPASLLATGQTMSRPSHQYDQYKQQTGIVPGALATTLAINQNNAHITGFSGYNLDYLGIGNVEEYDFNASPTQNSVTSPEMEMDFDTPAGDSSFLFPDSTINPSAISGHGLPSPVPAQTSHMGRAWPGMHQQAALAKAQAQQRQQQQLIQQQQQHQQQQHQAAPKPNGQSRGKGAQQTDPIVEQKISQLLNSMRARSGSDDLDLENSPMMNITRQKKDEEDMDEDERLLASEEGKKLSSKERRQLRNKVSARAFRSRRKEYITQLESEISGKVSENSDLRNQNRALMEENKRLSDLTRMLLASPSFSDFLERLSTNPSAPVQTQPTAQAEQRQETRQAPKDANPYAAQQQLQQIGMAMIPEQTMDFSMLSLESDPNFTYQPQVYAVLETPEIPVFDSSMLSEKTSSFITEDLSTEEQKIDVPVIEHPVQTQKVEAPAPVVVVDETFDNDPLFELYHDSPTETTVAKPSAPRELDVEAMSHVDIFGGIEPEKVLARYELVDASVEEVRAVEESLVVARVQRIVANLDAITGRLEALGL